MSVTLNLNSVYHLKLLRTVYDKRAGVFYQV